MGLLLRIGFVLLLLGGCVLFPASAPPRFPEFQEKVIASGSTYSLPQWSRDGRYLAYLETRSDTLQIYDTQSESTWSVADDVSVRHFAWTPSGELSYLIYRPDLSGSPFPAMADLHQVILQGTNDRVIAQSLPNVADFVWTSDYKRLLIVLGEKIGLNYFDNVYMLDLETGQVEVFLNSFELGFNQIGMIALSTDETVLMIYGITGQQSDPIQLLIYDIEQNTIRRRIVTNQIFPWDHDTNAQLAPSLAGSTNQEWVAGDRWFLAVVNAPTGECYNYALFFLDAIDTSNSFCIPSQGIIADPILSPDLTHIAYINVVGPGQEFLMVGNFPDAIKERLQSP